MMAGRIDLNVGFGIVMWHILAMGLQVMYGVPWPLADPDRARLRRRCVGLFNGLLVEVAQIDSFIATLGTGTMLYALALWFTDGRQIVGTLLAGLHRAQHDDRPRHSDPGALRAGARDRALDHQRAAAARPPRLRDRRQREGGGAERHPGPLYVIGVFVASALIAGFAGCILAAKLRIGQANVGLDYLLPALVGAFLGIDDDQAGPGQRLGHDLRRR